MLGVAVHVLKLNQGILSIAVKHIFGIFEPNTIADNEQVLPMVGNFIFVRPEPLPGFLIKLNIKN